AGHLDVNGAARPTLGIDDRVLHRVAPVDTIRNRMQLTGFRVMVGVRGVSSGQRSVEVAYANGVQLVSEFVDRKPAFHQSKGQAGMSDHVGVRTDEGGTDMAGR